MTRLVALFVSIILWWSVAAAQGHFRVHFFDVGQGDAVLIQHPTGPNVLYDGGESPSRIMAHLSAVDVSRIDLVVASHNHADHIGGLAEVIQRFRPRFYLDNGLPTSTLTYRRVLEAVRLARTQLLEPTRREIRLADNASLSVLPPSGNPGWDQNDNAVGLILEIGEFRLSMAGDAEVRQWTWWIRHHAGLLRPVDIHKASHHGSTNGDTSDALSLLSPGAVIISVGRDNLYRHPRPEALRLYGERGSTIFRTDVNGTIVVEVDTSGYYSIRPERGADVKPAPMTFTPGPVGGRP